MRFKGLLVIFLAVILSAGVFFAEEPAMAEEEFHLRFAHVVSPDIAKGRAAAYFAERIEEETDGRITVDVYPDSELGSDREIIEQMQIGQVNMNAPFTGVMPQFVEQYQLFDLPYLFDESEEVYEALHGEVGDLLDEYLRDAGFVHLGFWDGGFTHFTNSERPVRTPEDIAGLNIRASQSPLLIERLQVIDAGGTSVDFGELYTALEQGTVDGVDNTLANIYTNRFFEAQDYLSLTYHGYIGYHWFMDEATYNQMPEDLRETVHSVAEEVNQLAWEWAEEERQEYLEELRQADIEVIELTEEEREKFAEAMSPAYDTFLENVEGAEELLETIQKYTDLPIDI